MSNGGRATYSPPKTVRLAVVVATDAEEDSDAPPAAVRAEDCLGVTDAEASLVPGENQGAVVATTVVASGS